MGIHTRAELFIKLCLPQYTYSQLDVCRGVSSARLSHLVKPPIVAVALLTMSSSDVPGKASVAGDPPILFKELVLADVS